MNNDEQSYDLPLSYFKQGDDLRHSQEVAAAERKGIDTSKEHWYETLKSEDINDPSSHRRAFILHAEMLEESAKRLRRAAQLAVEYGLQIGNADNHHIDVIIRADIGRKLVEEGFLEAPYAEEEDLDDDDGADDDGEEVEDEDDDLHDRDDNLDDSGDEMEDLEDALVDDDAEVT